MFGGKENSKASEIRVSDACKCYFISNVFICVIYNMIIHIIYMVHNI